jgi:hypothetical protein
MAKTWHRVGVAATLQFDRTGTVRKKQHDARRGHALLLMPLIVDVLPGKTRSQHNTFQRAQPVTGQPACCGTLSWSVCSLALSITVHSTAAAWASPSAMGAEEPAGKRAKRDHAPTDVAVAFAVPPADEPLHQPAVASALQQLYKAYKVQQQQHLQPQYHGPYGGCTADCCRMDAGGILFPARAAPHPGTPSAAAGPQCGRCKHRGCSSRSQGRRTFAAAVAGRKRKRLHSASCCICCSSVLSCFHTQTQPHAVPAGTRRQFVACPRCVPLQPCLPA